MKNWLLLGVLILGLSSCGSPEYEKAIADWIQTDEDGTWTDLDFKWIELLGENEVTVSDSLRALKKKQEQQNAVIEMFKNPAILFKPPLSAYAKAEDNLKWIEARKAKYLERNSTEVLAKLIRCKYEIMSPLLGARQTKTETFLLTPSMDECLARIKDAD